MHNWADQRIGSWWERWVYPPKCQLLGGIDGIRVLELVLVLTSFPLLLPGSMREMSRDGGIAHVQHLSHRGTLDTHTTCRLVKKAHTRTQRERTCTRWKKEKEDQGAQYLADRVTMHHSVLVREGLQKTPFFLSDKRLGPSDINNKRKHPVEVNGMKSFSSFMNLKWTLMLFYCMILFSLSCLLKWNSVFDPCSIPLSAAVTVHCRASLLFYCCVCASVMAQRFLFFSTASLSLLSLFHPVSPLQDTMFHHTSYIHSCTPLTHTYTLT